jgi:hypothetical protein
MTWLKITSIGEIDPKALSLMGASVKDEGAIGEFGSGLKYAIACLLRKGVKFHIFAGADEISIGTEQSTFRNAEFGIITINGQPTSITTRTGPKWEIRDAVREIYSNALDEGTCSHGLWYLPPEGTAGFTSFFIENHGEVAEMTSAWHKYFVRNEEAWIDAGSVRVLRQATPNFFRRGIWICEDRAYKPLFSYDLDQFDLPESRRVNSGSFLYRLYVVLNDISEPAYFSALIENSLTECVEWDTLKFSASKKITERLFGAFVNAGYDYIGVESRRQRYSQLPQGKILWCHENSYGVLKSSKCPSIEEGLGGNEIYLPSEWPIGLRARVDAEIAYLKTFGVDMTKFSVIFGTIKINNALALADVEKKICVIGDLCEMAEPNSIRKALIEEWTHLEHDVPDCSVPQQHVYLNLITDLMARK